MRKLTLLLLLATLLAAPSVLAQDWRVDGGHSKITFTAEARFFSAEGMFRKFEVKADVDEKALENSKVSITVDTNSIDTNNERRDTHLRSKDFFDVATFSTATIETRSIRKISASDYEADATMTLHGVTKQIRLPVKVLLNENGRIRLRGAIELNRKEYGISYDSRMNPVEDIVGVRYELSLVKPRPGGPQGPPPPAAKQ